MQKSKHTELPWSTTEDGYIRQENGPRRLFIAAICDIPAAASGSTDANAAYIVRACNVHYELLEALKAVFVGVGDGAREMIATKNPDHFVQVPILWGALKKVQEAIRKAESE